MADDIPWDRALGTPLPERKKEKAKLQSLRLRRHAVTAVTVLVALIAILAAMRWGMQRWPGRGQLPDGFYDEDFLYSLQSKSSRLELPEGQSCDIHDDKGDLTCVPHTTWQQLMSAKVQLRNVERLRQQLMRSEQALAETRRLTAEESRSCAAEVRALKASAREAEKSLQQRRKAEEQARGAEKSTYAQLDQLRKESEGLSQDLQSCSAALRAAEQRLSDMQSNAASNKEAAVREARASCAEAEKRADAVEGELATCRGKLAGLGEGCSKCWHMLDESREELRHAQWRIGGAAAAVCSVTLLTAYVYARIISRSEVSQLRLEAEKLRCAAAEAQGGLRQRARPSRDFPSAANRLRRTPTAH